MDAAARVAVPTSVATAWTNALPPWSSCRSRARRTALTIPCQCTANTITVGISSCLSNLTCTYERYRKIRFVSRSGPREQYDNTRDFLERIGRRQKSSQISRRFPAIAWNVKEHWNVLKRSFSCLIIDYLFRFVSFRFSLREYRIRSIRQQFCSCQKYIDCLYRFILYSTVYSVVYQSNIDLFLRNVLLQVSVQLPAIEIAYPSYMIVNSTFSRHV